MITQSQQLIDEQKKQNATTFRLVKIGTAYCYTDCDQSIVYNSDTYLPWPLQVSGFRSSDGSPLDGGQIQLGNTDLTLSNLVLKNLIKDKDVYLYLAWLDANMAIVGVDMTAMGKVDGRPALDEQWGTITVAAHLNPWTQRFPRRMITKSNFPFIPVRGTKFTWGSAIIEVK